MGLSTKNVNQMFVGSGTIVSPCRDCKKRCVNCHANCIDYNEYRKAIGEINKKAKVNRGFTFCK